VNLKPVSVSQKPETRFELQAAKKIGYGEADVEMVEDGFYRRTGADSHRQWLHHPSFQLLQKILEEVEVRRVVSIPIHDE